MRHIYADGNGSTRTTSGRRPSLSNIKVNKVLSVKTALHTACRLAGVDPVTAYTLRHTAASRLVSRGLSTRKTAEFIGTGEQMVRDHHGHLAPDYQDEAAQMIGRSGVSVAQTVASKLSKRRESQLSH